MAGKLVSWTGPRRQKDAAPPAPGQLRHQGSVERRMTVTCPHRRAQPSDDTAPPGLRGATATPHVMHVHRTSPPPAFAIPGRTRGAVLRQSGVSPTGVPTARYSYCTVHWALPTTTRRAKDRSIG